MQYVENQGNAGIVIHVIERFMKTLLISVKSTERLVTVIMELI